MIIECLSKEEAERIINEIKRLFPNFIFNFEINSNYSSIVYLIINGNIDVITNDILKEINAKCVFSSLEQSLFFVTNKGSLTTFDIGSRTYRPNDGLITMIAGPCEIESFTDLYETASALKECGVSVFRAMPRKPRTSPYNFQGVGDIGWKYLYEIKNKLGLPILAEVFSQEEIDLALHYDIDIIQIGARNMQNYDLIKRAANSGITTVLKKGMWCNNEQLIKAAEYFFVYGKGNVILAERGIQTHESSTRNTFDLSSIHYLKNKTNQPVMADASHGTGVRNMVIPINCASVLMGADVIEVEVHINPDKTIKPGDYYQMLTISEYRELLAQLRQVMGIRQLAFDFE